jgi:hypothetical protein
VYINAVTRVVYINAVTRLVNLLTPMTDVSLFLEVGDTALNDYHTAKLDFFRSNFPHFCSKHAYSGIQVLS